jgi:hypothetical protein
MPRRGVAALLACALLFVAPGCGKDALLLSGIQRALSTSGMLCTAPLALPDVTEVGAVRWGFEEKMAEIGAFRRVRQSTVHGHRYTTYDLSHPSLEGTVYLARRTKSLPAVVRNCFGKVVATRVIEQMPTHQGESYFVRFAYRTDLYSWAESLRSYLRLPPNGVGRGYVPPPSDVNSPTYAFHPSVYLGLPVSILRFPPSGRYWYPHGFPPDLRHAFPRRRLYD